MKSAPRTFSHLGLHLFQIPRGGKKSGIGRQKDAGKRAVLSVSLARCGSALALSAFLMAGQAQGATYFWQPTDGGSFSWGTPGNWDLGLVPSGIGEVVNLTSNLTGAQTVSLDRAVTLGSLVIGDPDGSAGFTVAAGAGLGVLVLDTQAGSALIQKNSGANAADAISAAIVFNDSLTISNDSSGTLTLSGVLRSAVSSVTLSGSGGVSISGVISTGGSLVKTGAGTATLTGANTFAGSTQVQSGTLSISNAAALPARSAVTVAAGATLDYLNTATTIGSLSGGGTVAASTASAARVLTVGRDDTSTTFNGQILAPATKANVALTKLGAGVWTLAPLSGSSSTAAGDFTGATTLSGGALVLDFGQGTFSGTSMLAATPVTLSGGDLRVQ